MNKITVCVFVISVILSISIYFYNFCSKHTSKGNKVSSEFLNSSQNKIPPEKVTFDNLSDEDVKYLHDKGWTFHQVNSRRKSRRARSLASIANCLWRVLNYPYMYNFYPILNFGVAKIMTGLGDLINNVHFPLFSASSSSTPQTPLPDSEMQAQQLAYAQGQTLSQEVSTDMTMNEDTVRDTSGSLLTRPAMKTSPPDYQYSSDQDEEEKEKEDKLKEEARLREVDKKIDEKAAVLARKYVQLYFSQNKQRLGQDDSLQNNLPADSVQLPPSIENELNPTTELYDLNTV